MSKPAYAVQPGVVAQVDVAGRKMQVGSFHVDGNWGQWTTQGDDRSLHAGDAAQHPVSAESLKAAEKAMRDELAVSKMAAAASFGAKLPTGHLKGSPWVTSFGSDKSTRRTEIAVRLLGEMLRARVPSAVDERDFAQAITRLAIEGDGERMTKLAFFLADQVLAEEAAGNH